MEDPINIAKDILREVAHAKNFSTTTDVNEIFSSAEMLIGSLAYLTGPIVEAESAYRNLVVSYLDKEMSHAEAEARSKASEEYKKWKKLESVKELAEHQINLLKKFQVDLGKEWTRTK